MSKIVRKLTVMDAETDCLYEFNLSVDDYNRAINDVTYCTQLLQGARKTTQMNCVKENEVAEIADEVLPPIDRDLGNGTLQRDDNAILEAIDEGSDDQNDGFRWGDAAIKLLLATFKEREKLLNSGHMSVKKFWEMISRKLEENGRYKITGPQCKSKINGLKKTYKSIKDYNGKSGNNRRPWPYLEIMDDIFGKKPWVSPVMTLDSNNSMNELPDVDASSSSATVAEAVASSSDTATSERAKSAKRKKVSHEGTLQQLLESVQANSQMRQRMHDAAMTRQDRMLALLEKIADSK